MFFLTGEPNLSALNLSLKPQLPVEIKISDLSFPSEFRITFEEPQSQSKTEVPVFNPKEFTSNSFHTQITELLSNLSKCHPFYANALSTINRNGYKFVLYSSEDEQIDEKLHKLMGTAPAMTLTAQNLIFIRCSDLDSSTFGQRTFIGRLTNELVHSTLDIDSIKRTASEGKSLLSEALSFEKEGKKDWSNLEKDLFSHVENEIASTIIDETLCAFLYDKKPISFSVNSLKEDQFLQSRRKPNYLMKCLEVKYGAELIKQIEDSMRDPAKMPEDIKALLARFWRRLASSETEEALLTLFKALKVIN